MPLLNLYHFTVVKYGRLQRLLRHNLPISLLILTKKKNQLFCSLEIWGPELLSYKTHFDKLYK